MPALPYPVPPNPKHPESRQNQSRDNSNGFLHRQRQEAATTISVTNDANHTDGHTRHARDGNASSREPTRGCNR